MPLRSVRRVDSAMSLFAAKDFYDTPTRIREARQKLSLMKQPNVNGVDLRSSVWILCPSLVIRDPEKSLPVIVIASETDYQNSSSASSIPDTCSVDFSAEQKSESGATLYEVEIETPTDVTLGETSLPVLKTESQGSHHFLVSDPEPAFANEPEVNSPSVQESEPGTPVNDEEPARVRDIVANASLAYLSAPSSTATDAALGPATTDPSNADILSASQSDSTIGTDHDAEKDGVVERDVLDDLTSANQNLSDSGVPQETSPSTRILTEPTTGSEVNSRRNSFYSLP